MRTGRPSLAGYLDDEPRGAHADEAWARLSTLRLAAARRAGAAAPLRTCLLENPSAPGREKAQAALDDLDFRAAGDAPALRRYLDEHLDGAHRAAAQGKLGQALRDEAELLEDEPACGRCSTKAGFGSWRERQGPSPPRRRAI